MQHLNVEIKARLNTARPREILQQLNAEFRGEDHQVDTYFRVPQGRMKLREGTIEHNLIYYDRANQAGPKASVVHLYRPEPDPSLKALLAASLGVWQVVDKRREIYFIDNVKFHLDRVVDLGEFVEIEAIDMDGSIGEARLREQCAHYMAAFDIQEADLLAVSYSDLLGAQAL